MEMSTTQNSLKKIPMNFDQHPPLNCFLTTTKLTQAPTHFVSDVKYNHAHGVSCIHLLYIIHICFDILNFTLICNGLKKTNIKFVFIIIAKSTTYIEHVSLNYGSVEK